MQLVIITHLSVVSSRQRSYGRRRCEKENRAEAVQKKLLASGVSADEILEKLK